MKKRLGLAFIICLLMTISGCQQKTNTGSLEDQPTAIPTPTPVATPEPTETPEPEASPEPVVAPEDIT